MPKVFSEKEREYIRTRLKEEAAECMLQYGLRKTTVDELVKRVHIPKGTFYLFYESKELLMFDALSEYHEQVEKQLFANLDGIKDCLNVNNLTECIVRMMMDARNYGLIRLMESGDIEQLMRKLPEEVISTHTVHDMSNLIQLAEWIPIMKNKNLEVYTQAFQSIFMTLTFQKKEKFYSSEDTIRILVRGIVMQLLDDQE